MEEIKQLLQRIKSRLFTCEDIKCNVVELQITTNLTRYFRISAEFIAFGKPLFWADLVDSLDENKIVGIINLALSQRVAEYEKQTR